MRPHFPRLAVAVVFLTSAAACSAPPASDPASTSVATATASARPTVPSWTPNGTTPATPEGVDAFNPDSVATAVATTMWTSDTRSDLSSSDASARALPWLTPEYAALIAGQPPAGGAGWLELVDHDGYTTVDVRPADDPALPADTSTSAHRVRVVEVTPTGRDGWTGPVTTVVMTCTLTRDDPTQPWAVATITTAHPIGETEEHEHG